MVMGSPVIIYEAWILGHGLKIPVGLLSVKSHSFEVNLIMPERYL